MSRLSILMIAALFAIPGAAADPVDVVDAAYEEASETADALVLASTSAARRASEATDDEAQRDAETGHALATAASEGCLRPASDATDAQAAYAQRVGARGENAATRAATAAVHEAGRVARGGEPPAAPAPGGPSDPRPLVEDALDRGSGYLVDVSGTSLACYLSRYPAEHARTLTHDVAPMALGSAEERIDRREPLSRAYERSLATLETMLGAQGIDPYRPLEPPDVVGLADPIVTELERFACEDLDLC